MSSSKWWFSFCRRSTKIVCSALKSALGARRAETVPAQPLHQPGAFLHLGVPGRGAVLRRAGRQGGVPGRQVLHLLVGQALGEVRHGRRVAQPFPEQDHLQGDELRLLSGEGRDVPLFGNALRPMAGAAGAFLGQRRAAGGIARSQGREDERGGGQEGRRVPARPAAQDDQFVFSDVRHVRVSGGWW